MEKNKGKQRADSKEYSEYEKKLIEQFGLEKFLWEFSTDPPEEIRNQYYENDNTECYNVIEMESALNKSKIHAPFRNLGIFWEYGNDDLNERYGIFCMKKKKKTDEYGNHYYTIVFFGKKNGWTNVVYKSENFVLADKHGTYLDTITFEMVSNCNAIHVTCSLSKTSDFKKKENHSYMFSCERSFYTSNMLIGKIRSREKFENSFTELYEKYTKNIIKKKPEVDENNFVVDEETTSVHVDKESDNEQEEDIDMEAVALEILKSIQEENKILCEMRQEVLLSDTRGSEWAKSARKKVYCEKCFEFKKEVQTRDIVRFDYDTGDEFVETVVTAEKYFCYKDGKRNRISADEYNNLYVSSEHDFLQCDCIENAHHYGVVTQHMEVENENDVTIVDETTTEQNTVQEDEVVIPPVNVDEPPEYTEENNDNIVEGISYEWICTYMNGRELPYHLDISGNYVKRKKKFSNNYGNNNEDDFSTDNEDVRSNRSNGGRTGRNSRTEGINGGRRRRTGRRREQDDYYRTLAERTRISIADFLFMYVGSGDFDTDDVLNIITEKANYHDIQKLILILNDFFYDNPGIHIDNDLFNDFVTMLHDTSDMAENTGNIFELNTYNSKNNCEIFENVRLLQTTADLWARFMHSTNGNIKVYIDEYNKEIDVGDNKGGCLLNLLSKGAEYAGKTRPIDFEDFMESCPERFFYKYVSKNSLSNHVSKTEFDEGEEIGKEEFYEKYKDSHFFVIDNPADGNTEGEKKKEDEANEEEKNVEKKKDTHKEPNNVSQHQDDQNIGSTSVDHDPKTSKIITKLPLGDTLEYYRSELMNEKKKSKKAASWMGVNTEINFPNIYYARRDLSQFTQNNTTNVSLAVPLSHPFLDRPQGNAGAVWTEYIERDLGIKIFRIAIDNNKNVGSAIKISKNFDRLYNEINEGGDLNYFRPYFGTKWKDVVSKELLQQWVLQTKNLNLNRGTDVARWLRLFQIAQQCSDAVDANVFLNTADMEILPYNARVAKVRSAAFPDPVVNAEPNLFPLYRDDECTIIGGHRVCPAYTLTMDDFLRFVVFDNPLPLLHAFGAAYSREDIMSGKVAVVFVHPHMQGQASSLTYYTMTHMAGPVFHWTHRQRAGVVEYVDTGVVDDGLCDNNLNRVNGNYVDNAGNVIEYCDFDYCIQGNNVRIDGATKGVLYIRTTNFKSNISLVNGLGVTLPANSYIVGPNHAGLDAPVDIRPSLLHFFQNNQADLTMEKVASWINKETGNLADYKWAMGLYANFFHLSGMPVMETANGHFNKYISVGETAVYSNPPGSAPMGAGRWTTVAFRNILDENGVRMRQTHNANTIAAYNYVTNMFGQRPHRWNANLGGDFGYNTKINEMSIYERLGLMIGTHDLAEKVDLGDLIDNNIFEFTALGKRLATAQHKATDTVLQMTEVPMGYLLEPIYGANTSYQRTLETKYFSDRHPFSSYVIDLFDMFIDIPGDTNYTNFDKLYYHGQFTRQGNNHIHNYVQQILCKSKWHRDYNTIGFGANDHFKIPTFTEINWQKKKEAYYHDPNNGDAIRWRLTWEKPWTSIDEVEWTRLNVTDLGVNFIGGYGNYTWHLMNFISKERQSWNSWGRFFMALGITTYNVNPIVRDYSPRPFGTYHLLYDESQNKTVHYGTRNSVIPWTMITRGYLFAAIGDSAYNKYDIHAPQLDIVPNTNRIEVF